MFLCEIYKLDVCTNDNDTDIINILLNEQRLTAELIEYLWPNLNRKDIKYVYDVTDFYPDEIIDFLITHKDYLLDIIP